MWVEVNGKIVPESATKAGAESHVSLHNMFSKKIDEKDIVVEFKYK